MNDVVFITIVVTGFTVAFLHAAIPTHWLPFVVAARAQQWNRPKTLAITGVAGAGHVLFTTALGVLVVWGGMAIIARVHDLHIWAMSTTETALTAHLVKPDGKLDDLLLDQTQHELHDRFGIEHMTLQFECGNTDHSCSQEPKHVV